MRIPAATLIVVREPQGAAPELLMVERAREMAFAAGALVFLRRTVDPADRVLAHELGVDAAALAAIREDIEETAVPVGLLPLPSSSLAIDFFRRSSPMRLSATCLSAPVLRSTLGAHALRVLGTEFERLYAASTRSVARSARLASGVRKIVEGECAAAAWVSVRRQLRNASKGKWRA